MQIRCCALVRGSLKQWFNGLVVVPDLQQSVGFRACLNSTCIVYLIIGSWSDVAGFQGLPE